MKVEPSRSSLIFGYKINIIRMKVLQFILILILSFVRTVSLNDICFIDRKLYYAEHNNTCFKDKLNVSKSYFKLQLRSSCNRRHCKRLNPKLTNVL